MVLKSKNTRFNTATSLIHNAHADKSDQGVLFVCPTNTTNKLMPCNGRTPGERERAVKRNILLKLCNRPFLMERKAWVSSVSVSPLRGVVVFKKKKEKKNRTDTSKENHRNSLPSLLSPWWGGLLMLRTSHGRAA